ncbi:type II secretion system protein [Kiritimatiellaeota bacterium B1221]|nr:type II secretion system protein [Kiritimatiellaeota bacterium B1221]
MRAPATETPTGGGNRLRAGFTLIEMLVVIAILVLLISLIAPAGFRAMEKGARTRCLNNLRQIQTATLGWATEHQGRLPPAQRIGNYPHALSNYDPLFGERLGDRAHSMFCPGKLHRERNAGHTDQLYDTDFITYQYFNFGEPFQGSYQTDKPDLSRSESYPAGTAVWGCLTLRTSGGISLAHNEPAVSDALSGMNAAYMDGHAGWVSVDNLEVFYTAKGAHYFWPIP